jgi:hypothetical protein
MREREIHPPQAVIADTAYDADAFRQVIADKPSFCDR